MPMQRRGGCPSMGAFLHRMASLRGAAWGTSCRPDIIQRDPYPP